MHGSDDHSFSTRIFWTTATPLQTPSPLVVPFHPDHSYWLLSLVNTKPSKCKALLLLFMQLLFIFPKETIEL